MGRAAQTGAQTTGHTQQYAHELGNATNDIRIVAIIELLSTSKDAEVITTETFVRFVRSEQSGGLFLIVATVTASAFTNSPFGTTYLGFWESRLGELTLLHWINDALMAVFFLFIAVLVGDSASAMFAPFHPGFSGVQSRPAGVNIGAISWSAQERAAARRQ